MRARAARILAMLALAVAAPASADPSPTRVAEVRIVEDAMPRGPGVAERLAAIRRRIEAALVYPPSARHRALEGVTLVRFEIAGDGHALDLTTADSSGHWVLDRAAERAVVEAAPLPFVWGRLEVPVRFSLDD